MMCPNAILLIIQGVVYINKQHLNVANFCRDLLVCRDIFVLFCFVCLFFCSCICYRSLHFMWLYLIYLVVFLEKEESIICSKRRSFTFVIAVYLFLVHCDFITSSNCRSFGIVLAVFTCPWCPVIFITCRALFLLLFWCPAISVAFWHCSLLTPCFCKYHYCVFVPHIKLFYLAFLLLYLWIQYTC